MIAELPPKDSRLVRAYAEVALLRVALEIRQDAYHGVHCERFTTSDPPSFCTCGYDDAKKVLEVTK
jgi:hypothetical protein